MQDEVCNAVYLQCGHAKIGDAFAKNVTFLRFFLTFTSYLPLYRWGHRKCKARVGIAWVDRASSFHLVFDFFLSGGEGGWEVVQKSPTLAAHCPWRRVYVVSVGK